MKIKEKDAYKGVQEKNQVQRLKERFGQKKFSTRNKNIKTACVANSYILNGTSIVLALSGMIWLMGWLIDNYIIACFISLILLVIIEIGKRYSSDVFWDRYVSTGEILKLPVIALVFFFCISTISTIGGAYLEIIRMNEGKADIIIESEDPTLLYLQTELDSIESLITTMSNTKWKGTTTNTATRNIQMLIPSKTALLADKQARKKQILENNQKAIADHAIKIEYIAIGICLIILLLELAFEASMWYASYYSFRLLCELLGEKEAVKLFTENKDEAAIVILEANQKTSLPAAKKKVERRIGFQLKHQSEQNFQKGKKPETFKPQNLEGQGERLKVSPESFKKKQAERSEAFSEEQAESFVETLNIEQLKRSTRNWYRRRNETIENKLKCEAGKKRLKTVGYTVTEINNTKISIKNESKKSKCRTVNQI
jgi:hypothetical protein